MLPFIVKAGEAEGAQCRQVAQLSQLTVWPLYHLPSPRYGPVGMSSTPNDCQVSASQAASAMQRPQEAVDDRTGTDIRHRCAF